MEEAVSMHIYRAATSLM